MHPLQPTLCQAELASSRHRFGHELANLTGEKGKNETRLAEPSQDREFAVKSLHRRQILPRNKRAAAMNCRI
jgi:hypothetical protein